MYWHECLFGCWCHVCPPWSIYLVIFAFFPGIFVCKSEAAGVSYVKLSQGAWHGRRLKKSASPKVTQPINISLLEFYEFLCICLLWKGSYSR